MDSLDTIPDLDAADAEAHALGLAVRQAAERREDGWVRLVTETALTAAHGFPRGEARIALQLAPAAEAVAALIPALLSEHRRTRRRAMTLLPRLNPDEVCRQLGAALSDAPQPSRRAACVALAAVGSEALPLLYRLAEDADESVRGRAQRAIETIEAREPDASDRALSSVRPFGLAPPAGGRPARERSFAVAAFNFSYGVNLGALIRSAEAAGAEAVWIVGRDFYYRPSTKGADWWLPVEVLATPRECIERAKAEGYEIAALQQGGQAQPVWSAEWPQRPLIVAGNEGDGLPQAFLDAAALQVELPVYGEIDSLNVAVAASVAMYAWRGWRERQAAL